MIPYAVDASFDRRPVANWVIFAGIILVFLLQVVTSEEQITERPIVRDGLDNLGLGRKPIVKKEPVTGPMSRFTLDGWGASGLFGHNWLHANVVHWVFNLIFLWCFGNAVCAKLGNKAYLGLYLGLGFLGGVIHVLIGVGPGFGPSVAISGIVGVYLVLFPENSISCLFLAPHPMTVGISGGFVIFLWFVVDMLTAMFGVATVSYVVHILGFGAGFGLAVLSLKTKWLVMERGERSLLHMLGWEKQEAAEAEEEQKKEPEANKRGLKGFEIGKAEPEPAVPETKEPPEAFIRFRCQCGKKIKVRSERAGESGRCPRCHREVKVPER